MIKTAILLLISYIIGSLPWALIIGKVFYDTDVRNYGSHNLGGTNTLRVLGVLPGVTVILFDALKAFIVMWIVSYININIICYCGLLVCVGHCFPVFAKFKGGKAVACSCGYVLAINLFIEHQTLKCFIIPMIIFLIILFTTKLMSLASLSAIILATITGFIFYNNIINAILFLLLAIFVIYRHSENIKRLLNHTEKKLSIKK